MSDLTAEIIVADLISDNPTITVDQIITHWHSLKLEQHMHKVYREGLTDIVIGLINANLPVPDEVVAESYASFCDRVGYAWEGNLVRAGIESIEPFCCRYEELRPIVAKLKALEDTEAPDEEVTELLLNAERIVMQKKH